MTYISNNKKLLLLLLLLLSCFLIKIKVIKIYKKNIFTVYCINLDQSKDRWKKITKQAKQHKLKLIRHPAVYGKNINETILNKIGQTNLNYIHYDEYPGRLGCYLSHCEIYYNISMIKSNLDNVLIIEDDVEFVDNFKNKLENLISELPADWDMFFLWRKPLGKRENIQVSKNIIRLLDPFYGMPCYLINNRSSKKLVAKICNYEDINEPIDVKVGNLVYDDDWKIYATTVNKSLVYVQVKESLTDNLNI